ncbi:uncharacterized protein LOC122060095 [Macadamia integrifolia]|uniref:uncharacterized protein LOC122060095 n=1 Tax=Macadamia integrifolia TaxID=60698 RepID=UPI001C52C733|nr:uncharacterized protein LOC122060095 [Macadamia integrifolia]
MPMANSLLRWNPSMEMSGASSAGGSASGNTDSDIRISSRELQEMGHETVKQRVRKNGKSSGSSQKKPPQRGLGVAQLERLRLQERWKKMTEINQPHQGPLNNNDHQYQFSFPFADHRNGVSVPYSRFGPVNPGGLTNDGHVSTSHMQTQAQAHPLHPYRFANGGFSGNAGTFFCGRPVFPDQFQMDRLKVPTQEARFHSGNPNLYETSKELSSTQTQNQMLHCSSDQCDICKKKHIHGGNLGYNYIAPRNYHGDGFDYLSLNLGSNKPINRDQRRDVGVNPATFSVPDNAHEEAEVLAVHRQEKSIGGSVFMEYDFFPQKADRSVTDINSSATTATTNTGGYSSYTDHFFLAGVTAAGAAREASLTTHNTNSLDLSLKLSC